MSQPECIVEGCPNPIKAKGYCVKHYSRLRRHGHVEVTRIYHGPAIGACPVEDCDQEQDFNGMCKMHATRVARHGDPLAFTHQRDRNLPRGADNANWTGADVTYGGMHFRLRNSRGRAPDHACSDCGDTAKQWSYDHSDPDERLSEDGIPYSIDLNHYVPRCVSCHKKHDLSIIAKRKAPAGEVA